jgi:hypothetical protein
VTPAAHGLRRRRLALLLAAPLLCQAADDAVLERYARRHGWEEYAVAKAAGPGVPDVLPVTYSEKDAFAPSCALLATAPDAKEPRLLELTGPEHGEDWPRCQGIVSLAAFRLANRQYLAAGFVQHDTREDHYRTYSYFYRDASGDYVHDGALGHVARDGAAPDRPQDGVKFGRAAYLKKTWPQWRFLDQHFMSDPASPLAVFDEPPAPRCPAVAETGAAPVAFDLARCGGVLAASRLEQAGTVYYLALFRQGKDGQGIAVFSAARDGKVAAEERLAAGIVQAHATADVRTAKAALATLLR